MSNDDLSKRLSAIVGRKHVRTSDRATLRFRRGFRSEAGRAIAVVRPESLVEMWRTLQVCLAADVTIIMQAANTGLTGGSSPAASDGRPSVIINVMRLNRIHLLNGGAQIVALPGVTLHQLEQALRPLGREPHSVIGSSCFGASVVGGVCNNSGGSLVRRGPAYTELALYARVDEYGRLTLVNQLGLVLGDDPEAILHRLENGDFSVTETAQVASDPDYDQHVRQIDEPTPARFNADARRLCEASGSAGKMAIFGVRLDSFEKADETACLYIGTNDANEFTALRRALLSHAGNLPISAEYLHRDTFDIADVYGKDIFQIIRWLGTDRLPRLFAIKARFDALVERFGVADASDRLLQFLSRLLPDQLPRSMRRWREQYEHHLIVKVDQQDLDATTTMIERTVASGSYFPCDPDEAAKAGLHRFVAAGAAVRMALTQKRELGGIVALDVALRRNTEDWFGDLPADLQGQVVTVMRYGHFLCHVFHRDYLLAPGADPDAVKRRLLECLDQEGAEYPAEHNVGRQYAAKPALRDFYQKLDPTNRFNPGIGKTSPLPDWQNHISGETS